MCPLCLAATGLYVAGGLSVGAVTTFLAARAQATRTDRIKERKMSDHQTGTREEWLAARLQLLEAEKELTRRGDDLARAHGHAGVDHDVGGSKRDRALRSGRLAGGVQAQERCGGIGGIVAQPLGPPKGLRSFADSLRN